jgi:hypothetical protein
MIAAAEILPENLADAWKEGIATALSIATTLSQRFGQTLPWKTVKDVVTASINARFTELEGTSGEWPCEFPAAQSVKLKVASQSPGGKGQGGIGPGVQTKCLVAHAELEPSEIQDLADMIPSILEVKAKFNYPLKFWLQVEFGDGNEAPPKDAAAEINEVLKGLKDGFELQ